MLQTYNQRAVNLMIATAPISLAVRLDYTKEPPNLAYHPDARDTFDIFIDTYPLFHDLGTSEPDPTAKPKITRYYNPIHADIIDYLQHEQMTTNSTVIAALFGIDLNEASDRLYELAVLGKLRKLRYRHNGSDNLYTLVDRQLTLADIPNGARNDRVLALHAKGYDYATLGRTYGVSSDVTRRLCKSWPSQRALLLAPPTTGV
jgi:hypothetical protein